jgi:hypothetical protein
MMMELITAYLYNHAPFPLAPIHSMTFHKMKLNGWYLDLRTSENFKIFNKRFQIHDKWFRVIVRFQKDDFNSYKIDTPLPFVITETVTEDGVFFTDTKVYHGRQLKNTIGYLLNGIPHQLIDAVFEDLKKHIVYLQNDEGDEFKYGSPANK